MTLCFLHDRLFCILVRFSQLHHEAATKMHMKIFYTQLFHTLHFELSLIKKNFITSSQRMFRSTYGRYALRKQLRTINLISETSSPVLRTGRSPLFDISYLDIPISRRRLRRLHCSMQSHPGARKHERQPTMTLGPDTTIPDSFVW